MLNEYQSEAFLLSGKAASLVVPELTEHQLAIIWESRSAERWGASQCFAVMGAPNIEHGSWSVKVWRGPGIVGMWEPKNIGTSHGFERPGVPKC